ncbi:citrate transporter [Prauserella marina]|uniref:Citrate-Mg2+:H+ or citrate-Ca2+:H+ symporter, CitMHS family n=1 Tax=Prauserella marina TaxID=530584 RepID=A0A222VPR1_9PSEU|nr:citrate:proton symporter [Prauserella marina]ASR35905.1 citrate transporter [Prauserella marina]PWV84171.1 CitMHS family citrate-Mg2+:H+ or citrate-Ca2+:H+ symporter [Prauserella marina]SDC28838.1 citrate-Mg2+:H+ or citrate-Ca2+:H+ symporter, CitMHS family [Prauserella marina]
MLSLTGFLTIGVILALLLTNRVAGVVALAGVPVLAGLIAGFTPSEIGEFVGGGLEGVAGVATMFVFAIVYFGVMRDAGLFDPLIRRIMSFAGKAPVTICVATTALACAAHLDGAGATTFLITIPAMLPLFDRLGMSRLVLTTCVGLGAGVMNLLPWGGPGARAAATTGEAANDLWVPLIPAQAVGVVAALGIAWLLGRREQRRLAAIPAPSGDEEGSAFADADEPVATEPAQGAGAGEDLRRPRLLWFNTLLTIGVIACLVTGVAPPELLFLVAAVIALVVNYPGLRRQTVRIEAHAKGAMLMATTLLAAGVLLGILEGSGMIEAMASTAAGLIPEGAAPALPLIVGVLGVPLSLLFGPDAFYFGVLPVLNGVAEQFGVASADIAQAALLGQETVGFPISPLTGSFYLLVGLAGVEIGRHIRHLFGWAWLVSLIMLLVAVATGAVPLWAS